MKAEDQPTIREIMETYISPSELPDPEIFDSLLVELEARDIVMRTDAFHAGYGKGYAQDLAFYEGE